MNKIITPGHPDFYINRNRYVETYGEAVCGVEGFFTGRALRNGKVVREFSRPAPNLLTDIGLNSLGTNPGFTRMHLGTGTTPPAFSDTGLAAFGTNVVNAAPVNAAGGSGVAPYYGRMRLTWTSLVGGAVGNWTEIGVSNQNTNGNLRSRALILDSGGSPTTFPVLSGEQFQGTYEFRVYAPSADNAASITLSGASYTTTTRALQVATYDIGAEGSWAANVAGGQPLFEAYTSSSSAQGVFSSGLVAVTASSPTGALGNATSATSSPYSSGSYQQDVSARWGAGAGVGAVRTVRYALKCGCFQIEYAPSFAKLTAEEFIHNQRVSWARR